MSYVLAAPPDVARPVHEGGRQALRFHSFDAFEGGGRTGLDIGSVAVEEPGAAPFGLNVTLAAIDVNGHIVNALPIRFTHRVTVGTRVTVVGGDENDVIRVVARVDEAHPTLQLNLSYEASGTKLPDDLLSPLRFLRSLRSPRRLALLSEGRFIGQPIVLPPNASELPPEEVELVRSLAFVQRMTRVRFPVPDAFAPEDLRAVEEAETLLRGQTVTSRWTNLGLRHDQLDPVLLDMVGDGSSFRLEFIAPAAVSVAGNEVVLGEARYLFRVAMLRNPEGFRPARAGAQAGDTEMNFRPGDDDAYELRLVSPPERPLADREAMPPLRVPPEVLDEARKHPFDPAVLQAPDR